MRNPAGLFPVCCSKTNLHAEAAWSRDHRGRAWNGHHCPQAQRCSATALCFQTDVPQGHLSLLRTSGVRGQSAAWVGSTGHYCGPLWGDRAADRLAVSVLSCQKASRGLSLWIHPLPHPTPLFWLRSSVRSDSITFLRCIHLGSDVCVESGKHSQHLSECWWFGMSAGFQQIHWLRWFSQWICFYSERLTSKSVRPDSPEWIKHLLKKNKVCECFSSCIILPVDAIL